jgi:N6-adenosine-specific RNA methylase IME4
MTDPFHNLPKQYFRAILADPPWHFQTWARARKSGAGIACRASKPAYATMIDEDIAALPLADLAAPDCVLFMWTCWPVLQRSFHILEAWGFKYKTCAFSWMKGDPYRLWADEYTPRMGLGYWTRANTEPCLLATRGKPKRIAADIRQGILEQPREHSRKPDCVHERIERLVAGPYLELFARARRDGWTVWGNQTDKFTEAPRKKFAEIWDHPYSHET